MTPLSAPLPTEWPAAPGVWSPSALHAAETCPRRWALQRAPLTAYGGNPFPHRPSSASVEGEIVHLAVERIIVALRNAGVSTVDSPDVPQVLASLGWLDGVVRQASDDTLDAAQSNPRFGALGSSIRRGRCASSESAPRDCSEHVGRSTGDPYASSQHTGTLRRSQYAGRPQTASWERRLQRGLAVGRGSTAPRPRRPRRQRRQGCSDRGPQIRRALRGPCRSGTVVRPHVDGGRGPEPARAAPDRPFSPVRF